MGIYLRDVESKTNDRVDFGKKIRRARTKALTAGVRTESSSEKLSSSRRNLLYHVRVHSRGLEEACNCNANNMIFALIIRFTCIMYTTDFKKTHHIISCS